MKNYVKILAVISICLLCACQKLEREIENAEITSSKIESIIERTDTDIMEITSPVIQSEDRNTFSYCLMLKEQTILSRQDHSVCSSMCYEMPIILSFDEELQEYTTSSDKNPGVAAVNAIFEQKCRNFFEDAAEFTALSKELATHHAGELGKFYNELKTQVTQCDKSIFSVCQIVHWCTYGLENWSISGLTFNLETGELLTLDAFLNMDYATFNNTILDFLFDNIPNDWRTDTKKEFYKSLFKDFSDHEFFCADGSLYIIFPAISNEDDLIVQWSIVDSIPVECFYGTFTHESNI